MHWVKYNDHAKRCHKDMRNASTHFPGSPSSGSPPPKPSLPPSNERRLYSRHNEQAAQRSAALLPLDATANATHPPINATPPSGVMGPMTLKRCGSRTSMYIEPLNMVIPATSRLLVQTFWEPGKAVSTAIRATECMIWVGC